MKKITKYLYLIVRIITITFITTAIFRMIKDHFDTETLSNHLFIIRKSFSLLLISFIPNILNRLGFKIPSILLAIYIMSFTAALLFGEMLGFYKTIRIWDSLVHFFNGGFVAIVGFSVINLLNNQNNNSKLSPLVVVLFGFCFAMTTGVIWELIEWGSDAIMGSNMQRFRDNFDSTISFQGREALFDTMKDFLLNTLGSLMVSILAFFDLRKHQYIYKWFLITKKTNEIPLNT